MAVLVVVTLLGGMACDLRHDLSNAETTRTRIEAEVGVRVPRIHVKTAKADVGSGQVRTLFISTERELSAAEREKTAEITRRSFEVSVDRIEYQVCSPSTKCPDPEGY